MPVKIQNSFSPTSEVGAALNNAITNYANSIPTYGEAQEGRINANKADSPVALEQALRSLYSQAGDGQTLTPQMVQDNLPQIAKAMQMGGSIGEVGNLLRTSVYNSANPESTKMKDNSYMGAGGNYAATESGFQTKEANDMEKVAIQQAGADRRAATMASATRLKAPGMNPVTGVNDGLTPTMRAAKATQERARQAVDIVLGDISSEYAKLQQNGALVDINKGAGANILARLGNTDTAQFAQGFLGTKDQSNRNQIASLLPLVKTQVMAATGMSAKMMDSNVEMKAFEKTLTDPKSDVQAINAHLGRLSKLFGLGKLSGGVPAAGAPAPTVDNGAAIIAPPPPAGERVPTASHVQELVANQADPEVIQEFDDFYGPGMAEKYLGIAAGGR